ncbi:MAG: hypothetical protein SLRJCFUN_002626 [Candidatus Fervidibacter sp.]|jgi:hypothetical protein
MAKALEQIPTLRVEQMSPEDLLSLAEQTWSPMPDLNFEYLQDWLARGFQVTKVGWLTRYGPAYGGPAILFLLRNAEGREIATMVAPGKKVIEFVRQHLEEWRQKGVPFERWNFLTQPESDRR